MKLEKTNFIPDTERRNRHDLQEIIDGFCNSDVEMARVVISETDYKTIIGCYNCMYRAIKRSKHPVKVVKRGNSIYLVKNSYLKRKES